MHTLNERKALHPQAHTGLASLPHCSRPARPLSSNSRSRCTSTHTAALPEWLRKTFDFGSWAPKSARIWRLQDFDIPDPSNDAQKPSEVEQSIDDLQIRASEMAKQEKQDSASPAFASRSSQDSRSIMEDSPEPTKSFAEADDGELAQALRARLESMSSSSEDEDAPANEQLTSAQIQGQPREAASASGTTEDDDDEVEPLTGEEMRELIWAKYGKAYDVSFARRDVPGKAFVCLNIMWQHLEQRSFKMTEAQYIDKVDSVAYMVNVLGQTERVRGFLSTTARSERGLPRRPVVGTAISIQLDLPPDVVQDFFGKGYY